MAFGNVKVFQLGEIKFTQSRLFSANFLMITGLTNCSAACLLANICSWKQNKHNNASKQNKPTLNECFFKRQETVGGALALDTTATPWYNTGNQSLPQ